MSERMNNVMTGLQSGPAAAPKSVNRCPHCFEELFEADNGYGGTRLACPTHGFDRSPIITVPAWFEDSARQFPDLSARYFDWLLTTAAEGGER